LIGYFYMLGIIVYILFIGVRHKSEFWEAIRGKDGKLETPELITMLVIIVYINLILADTFLGLTPSEGVFWSLDCIILFALTGRVMMNKFGNGKTDDKQIAEVAPVEVKKDDTDKNQKISFILKNSTNYEKSELENLSEIDLNKIYDILQEAEDNIDEARIA
jgi:cation transport ATPase